MRESRRPPLFQEVLSSATVKGLLFVCIFADEFFGVYFLFCIFATVMRPLSSWLVWLSRIHRCRGFGIQSPTDYAFVRYVVNEHWPYYAYSTLQDDDWLTQKLGRLYFRLANWRQPSKMVIDNYMKYLKAGSRKTVSVPELEQVELARMQSGNQQVLESLLSRCNKDSVLVIEGIGNDREFWRNVQADERVGTTFDLYYCGILFFDKRIYKHHYTINF